MTGHSSQRLLKEDVGVRRERMTIDIDYVYIGFAIVGTAYLAYWAVTTYMS